MRTFKDWHTISGQPRSPSHAVAEKNTRLILMVMASRFPSLMADAERVQDAFTFGFLYLLKAAERFDPRRGVTFSTFAKMYIRGGLLRFLENERASSRLPVAFSLDAAPPSKSYTNPHDQVADPHAEAPGQRLIHEIGFAVLIQGLPERQQWVLRASYQGESILNGLCDEDFDQVVTVPGRFLSFCLQPAFALRVLAQQVQCHLPQCC